MFSRSAPVVTAVATLLLLSMVSSEAHAQAQRTSIQIETSIGSLEFLAVPAGEITVGRDIGFLEQAARSWDPKRLNEGPAVSRTIKSPFLMGRRKVTVAQYAAFLNSVDPTQRQPLVTSAWRVFLTLEGDTYRVKEGMGDRACGFITYEGGTRLAEKLAKELALPVRVPFEAEFMLAATGPKGGERVRIEYVRNEKKQVDWDQYPQSIAENGFEDLLSSVGEWNQDKNEEGDRLLKRTIPDLESREYKSDQHPDGGSRVYGLRLLIDARLVPNEL